ncbi:MAG: hypothetical protein WCG27_01180 [Pseudomonadota bacterium]
MQLNIDTITDNEPKKIRTSLNSVVGETSTKTCLHSRKLVSYLDSQNSPQHRRQYHALAKHIDNCGQCTRQLQTLKELWQLIDRHIPRPEVDSECQKNFHREMKDILKSTSTRFHAPHVEGAISKFFNNLLGD